MNAKQISNQIDVWISEEELPTQLRPIRMFDSLYAEDKEEKEAYLDFMHWHFERDWQLLNTIPADDINSDFWNPFHNDDSAFNTIDFQNKTNFSFNRYHYRIKKVYERIKELAIMHSSISDDNGRANIKKRYFNLVDDEFRTQRDVILKSIKDNPESENAGQMHYKLSELNSRIRKAASIWQQYAYWD